MGPRRDQPQAAELVYTAPVLTDELKRMITGEVNRLAAWCT